MQLLAVILFMVLPLAAQHITYSSDSLQKIDATVWHVVACSDKQVNIPAGLIFQHLAVHGAQPLSNSQMLSIFQTQQARSWEYKAVTWAGYVAIGGAYLMQTDIIKANTQWKAALTGAGGFLGVVVPLVQKAIPPLNPLLSNIIGSALIVPAGGCSSPDAIWLGAALLKQVPANFEVTLP